MIIKIKLDKGYLVSDISDWTWEKTAIALRYLFSLGFKEVILEDLK
ncbi:MAG: hypothetical protein WC346_09135 [Methanogenium sp.]|jgi:hypothetical protein